MCVGAVLVRARQRSPQVVGAVKALREEVHELESGRRTQAGRGLFPLAPRSTSKAQLVAVLGRKAEVLVVL